MFSALTTAGNVSAALTTVTQFDPKNPTELSLGVGIYYIEVVVTDDWGATTLYTIPTEVTVFIYSFYFKWLNIFNV